MLSGLFIAALWSPVGKELASVVFSCIFVTYPYGVPGLVLYLIVSIPYRCLPLYFWIYIESTEHGDL